MSFLPSINGGEFVFSCKAGAAPQIVMNLDMLQTAPYKLIDKGLV